MPRAYDLHRLQITHDPNLRLDQSLAKLPLFDPAKLAELLLNFLVDHLEEIPILGPFVEALEQLLDADGDGQVEFQDVLDLLMGKGVIAAILNGGLLGNIELGQLIKPQAGQERNWLEPFDAEVSIEADSAWSWDGTVGRTAPGSARCALDGAEHVQHSAVVDAAPGQQVAVSGWLSWDSVTASGSAFVLRVLAYDQAGAVKGSQVIGTVSDPAATADWSELSGMWAVPAGASYVRVRMECLASGMAGTVWWDDLTLRKPSAGLPMDWISGLLGALADLLPLDQFQDLLDGVSGILGGPSSGQTIGGLSDLFGAIPQANVDGLSSALQGAADDVQALLDKIANAVGLSGVGHTLADLFGALQAIPQGNVSGLDSALADLLSVDRWDDFLAGLTGSAGSGSSGGTGFPAIDDALDAIGSLFGKADTAQSDAASAQSTAASASVVAEGVQHTAVATMTGQDGLTYSKQEFTASGTWTVPTASPGMKIVRFDGIVIGGGDGGGKPAKSSKGGAPGGLGGGFLRKSLAPSDVTASSYAVTIGQGGAGASSTGPGGDGGQTSIGALWQSPEAGTAAISTAYGDFLSQAAPGRGGDGGTSYISDVSGDSSSVTVSRSGTDGTSGEPSLLASGGSAGRAGTGWLGGGSSSPGSGGSVSNQPAGGACGGGGGGGGASATSNNGNGQTGGDGGSPGGGGGGGGVNNGGGGFIAGSPGNGGSGAHGYACVITVQAPLWGVSNDLCKSSTRKDHRA